MGISIPRWYPFDAYAEELEIITKRDAWIELRSMRTHLPAAAGSSGRADVFRSALEQSEQLFRAAEEIGYESRPLLLFYGISQAGRAIAAASRRLANSEWSLSGHGIRATGLEGSIDAVALSDQGTLAPGKNHSFLRVAQALASPSIPSRVAMRDLWYLLPELRGQLKISKSEPYPALFLHDPNVMVGKTTVTACVWGLPFDFTHDIGWAGSREYGMEAKREVAQYLAHYPSLSEFRFATLDPPLSSGRPSGSIAWGDEPYIEKAHDGGVQVAVELEGRIREEEYGFNHPAEYPHNALLRRASFSYPSLGMRILFPTITGNDKPLHPLLAWWAILYGMSMLARYEPSSWVRAINVNENRNAVILEILLDEAMNACPPLILEACRWVL
jgi:hypothetical protein